MKSLRSVGRVLLTIAAIAAVAVFLYRQRHLFTGFGSATARAHWYWIAVAFGAEMASMLPLAQAERLILRAARVSSPLAEMTAVTFASNAIASSVPGGAALAEGYAFKRYKHLGAGDGEAAWAELATGAVAFSALAGIALAGGIIDSGRLGGIFLPILAFVFAGSAAAAELFRRPDVLCRVVDAIESRVRRGEKTGGLAQRLRDIADEIGDIRAPVVLWASAYSLSALNWLLDVACLALCFVAFDAPVPWAAILLAFAGTKVVSSIGITPGGLGLVEGGMVATLVAYHVPAVTAAAVVVVYRVLTLVGLVGIGWVMVGVLNAHGNHPHAHR